MNDVALLISDVDGTLVTRDKVLTQKTVDAVHSLRSAGIKFAITSGRPPAGMATFVAPLALETPIAGFNGGVYVDPADGKVVGEHLLDPMIARRALDVVLGDGLDAWVFTESRWVIRDPNAPLVAREHRTIQLEPTIAADLSAALGNAAKIVGVSEDHGLVERCEAHVRSNLGAAASAVRSQPYYLDITHPQANKGAVVDFLSARLHVPPAQIATIGDMPNDVLMFGKSGLSIAMGNASDDVKRQAAQVTASCDADGFAQAVDRFILRRRLAS
jgi:Cof subfamily protein (haloacid dehalogenase superfamily)